MAVKHLLSVVVPCYNEEKNIPLIFKRFNEMLTANADKDIEVILVDNGSTDQTAAAIAHNLKAFDNVCIRTVHVPVNQGYGFGIISGLNAAKGNVLSWTHADMQTDPMDVAKAFSVWMERYEKMPEKELVVKGRRINRPLSQWVFTLGMSVIASFLLRRLFHDINAQPKLFSKNFWQLLPSPPHDFSLDLYLLYCAKKYGIAIFTIDVLFKQRLHGTSNWAYSFRSKYKTILRTIRYMLELRRALAFKEVTWH